MFYIKECEKNFTIRGFLWEKAGEIDAANQMLSLKIKSAQTNQNKDHRKI
jgi:hypothetical protein